MQSNDEAGAKVTVDRSWNTEVQPNIWDPPTLRSPMSIYVCYKLLVSSSRSRQRISENGLLRYKVVLQERKLLKD